MAFGPLQRLRARWQEWPAETRFSVGVLGTCGIAVLILSYMQFRSNVVSPFRVPIATLTSAQEKLQTITDASEARRIERLKTMDTDRDGLSDYAEIYIYKTSPYLADSDSDGIPDAIEIAQGTDPNCPMGRTCGAVANADLQPIYNVTSSYNNLLDTTQVRPVGDPSIPGGADATQRFILEAPDPSAVSAARARELLTGSGLIPADQLTGLSDADILQVYRATYAQVMQIREGLQNPTQ